MGNLVHDPNTGWFIADYYDSLGVRHRKKVSRVAPEARKMLALLEGQAVRDRMLDVRPLKRVGFDDFAVLFLDHARAHLRSWRRYESCIASLHVFFDNRAMTDIDAESIEAYKQKRLADVTPATINRDLQCLKRMFNLAIPWNYSRENPVKWVRFFRESFGRVRYLKRDEYTRLLAVLPSQLVSIVTIAVNTGMRRGEMLALIWQDVDLENGFVSINDPKNASPRKVPLNVTARKILAELERARSKGTARVFLNAAGEPLPARTLQDHFTEAPEKAGIEDFRFHDLRHTCASWMAMAGVPILTIKEILGHKDIRMTMRYAHLAIDQRVEAVRMLDAFIQQLPVQKPESKSQPD